LAVFGHRRQSNVCVLQGSCGGHDWTIVHPAEKEEFITLVFALQQRNLDVVHNILMEVSDPDHSNYGKHLTFEELGALTANPEAETAVMNFLLSHGVSKSHISVTPNKEFMRVRMTVEIAENILSTRFSIFRSIFAKAEIIRTLEYTIPMEIVKYVRFIGYTIQFPPLLRPGPFVSSYGTPGASGEADPALLKQFYKVNINSCTNKNSSTSLFEDGQDFAPADLTQFQKQFNLTQQAVAKVVGPDNSYLCKISPNSCIEANLDVEYIMAMSPGAATTFWGIATTSQDPFLDWIEAVAASSDAPLIHSISYGSIESELDPDQVNSFSDEAMKLGVRGVSIFVSSGDDGVANYIARDNPSACGFNPSFPASVPYVTAVGATQGPEYGTTEIMCSSSTNGLITSGGGFSTVFTQPSYQSSVVNAYLKNGPNMPPTSQFNSQGRGYPDVALLGHNYLVVIGGQTYEVSGTSCSSPTVAGMIALVNDARMNAGKAPVGFLNTALYKASSNSYNDITSGTNNCCAGSPGSQVCCKYGFTCTAGWDPSTGLGTLNFANLASYLIAN
jgi:tripeptidyl-peptidase-1